MTLISSFFDSEYQTPTWLKKNISRRAVLKKALKSAAGASSIAAFPVMSTGLTTKQQVLFSEQRKTEPWLTLDATLAQLLPASPLSTSKKTSVKNINEKDISAQNIHALEYLYQVMTIQPTEQDEKDFIVKGVGWLNSYAKSEKGKIFTQLAFDDKEKLLRGISRSLAGENWINTLLNYIFEAMLSPPSYGGNPKGIGWQWLEHQAGFPLPSVGERYFELPARSHVLGNTLGMKKS
ncbi:MAG: gluconate 2-dehydrogenase subunit 3 family protein [Colwellia sp.]